MPPGNDAQSQRDSIEEFYDLLAPSYDAMTGFDKRFAVEGPHFQALVTRYKIRKALDAGCGSGFHSILLAQLGLEVTSVDVSSAMLHLAEEHAHMHNAQLEIIQASFTNLAERVKGPFGAVFVMGNSLAHLLTKQELTTALQNFAAVLGPGGILFLQSLNYQRVLARRENIQSAKEAAGRRFVRSYDYDDAGILFKIQTTVQQEGQTEEHVQTIRLRPVLHEELMTLLHEVGFHEISLFGSIALEQFDPAGSKDLVVLALKRA